MAFFVSGPLFVLFAGCCILFVCLSVSVCISHWEACGTVLVWAYMGCGDGEVVCFLCGVCAVSVKFVSVCVCVCVCLSVCACVCVWVGVLSGGLLA